MAPISLDEAMTQASYEGQGIFHFGEDSTNHDTQLVCGHFEFNNEYKHPLIDHLPQCIIRNENDSAGFSWLKDSLRFMAHVAKSEQVGSSAIIKRLSEIIMDALHRCQIVRMGAAYLSQQLPGQLSSRST